MYKIDEAWIGVPKPPFTYTEENNAQVIVIPEDVGSPFSETGADSPDGFNTNSPGSFQKK